MVTLAHISDVHLAPLPPVRLRDLFSKRITGYLNWRFRRHSTLSGEGLHTLVQHLKQQRPDFIAVTGDLVNLGLEAEADIAWNWLQTVGASDEVAVAPGNHDAYVKPSLGWNAARWGDYMRGETLDDATFPYVRRIGDVAIIACSSAVPTGPGLALGVFDEEQAGRLARILRMLGDSHFFRVIMIHHPPNLESRHPRLGLYGAKLFRQIVATHGAELILHGHTHKSTIFAIPGKSADVPVIGVAAAGSAQREEISDDPARYNLFKIERQHGAWSCTLREFGFQRLSSDIVLRLNLRIY